MAMRIAVFLATLTLTATAAQAADYRAPRDSYGRPSFEGTWTNITATPLERPAMFNGAATTAPQQAAVYEKAAQEAFFVADAVDARHSEWYEKGWTLLRIDGQLRTSLIVDPADGKLPFSERGRQQLATSLAAVLSAYDGPESRTTADRCLQGNSSNTGAPMLPANYNNHYQVLQTRETVAIYQESMHDLRLIPLGARRAAPAEPRRWMGNSVGWFEGETLVVETAGFNPSEGFKSPGGPFISPQARVTERFTRIAPDEVLYEFTVDDRETYQQPWRARSLLTAFGGRLFEYACHEGNYALEGILAGARQAEDAARRAGR
jgi:hypothetical protein